MGATWISLLVLAGVACGQNVQPPVLPTPPKPLPRVIPAPRQIPSPRGIPRLALPAPTGAGGGLCSIPLATAPARPPATPMPRVAPRTRDEMAKAPPAPPCETAGNWRVVPRAVPLRPPVLPATQPQRPRR